MVVYTPAATTFTIKLTYRKSVSEGALVSQKKEMEQAKALSKIKRKVERMFFL